jgi:hypothetical protein
MASNTQQTEKIRRRKEATAGRKKRKKRTRAGTPKFPIHPA